MRVQEAHYLQKTLVRWKPDECWSWGDLFKVGISGAGDQVTISVPRLGSMRTASDWCHNLGLASPQKKKNKNMR